MRIRSLVVTMAGVALAAGSVYASREFLQVQPATASIDPSAPALVSVVVASQDIPFGSTIEGHKLTTIQWPAEAVPAGTYSDFSILLPSEGNEPRRAKRPMAQGELILGTKVSDFGEKVTIGSTLEDGHRAMAIKVSAETAVGGFVTPGDRVDIVLTRGSGMDLQTLTVLQNIKIVGVDQTADELNETANVAKTVTVSVTPEEGQKLALVQKAGQLSLSLRGDKAGEDGPLDTVRLIDVLGDKSPVEEQVERNTVTVRRGATDIEEFSVKRADN